MPCASRALFVRRVSLKTLRCVQRTAVSRTYSSGSARSCPCYPVYALPYAIQTPDADLAVLLSLLFSSAPTCSRTRPSTLPRRPEPLLPPNPQSILSNPRCRIVRYRIVSCRVQASSIVQDVSYRIVSCRIAAVRIVCVSYPLARTHAEMSPSSALSQLSSAHSLRSKPSSLR